MIQFDADSLYEFGEDIRIGKFGTEVASSFVIGYCLFHNDLKRFAFFSAFGDVFELYDCRNTPRIMKNYRGCLPVMDKDLTSPTITLETKLGVQSSTATDKYILALYSDHLMKEFSLANDKMWWVDQILVYDWEGDPVKILVLDRPVRALTYNREKGLVYCIGLTEEGNNIFYFDPEKI